MSNRAEKALRIAISDAQAKKSAVSELILQQLETYGATSDASGALENVDLLVTTGAEFSANAPPNGGRIESGARAEEDVR